jgi:glycosyltransferase involved in cell wall biosynthesis
MKSDTVLWMVIPCYNEEIVLKKTAPMFLEEMNQMVASGLISDNSRILFVNDGSSDSTWSIIQELSKQDRHFIGIAQSRNRGHQNAVLAGLMEAMNQCDITISIDCDGQDDIHAMEEMVRQYHSGSDIVYGVRNNRDTDSWFKRTTAQSYYKLLNKMDVEVVYNHADYRLVSSKVLHHFADFHEVNLFLRGMFPLVGFRSTCVYYKREERIAGQSHYPLSKMLHLAFDGITSLSIKPIQIIAGLGLLISLVGFAGIIWVIIRALMGMTVAGWASMICIVTFMGGVQLLSLGVIGTYVGKTYMETKHRPRYIISQRTWEKSEEDINTTNNISKDC